MTFISLFSDEHGFVATDQIIYSPGEVSPLSSVLEQASLLQSQLQTQSGKLEELAEEARLKAYQEGLAEGRAEAALELVSQMRRLGDECAVAMDEMRNSSAALAVEIVRKIAGEGDQLEWIVAQAQQVAQQLIDEPVVKLCVNPVHVAAIQEKLQDCSTTIQAVVADELLKPSECLLETSIGQIDVSLDVQLDAVLAMLDEENPEAG